MFGKALGNGYAITSVIGRREVMEHAQSSFVVILFGQKEWMICCFGNFKCYGRDQILGNRDKLRFNHPKNWKK